MQSRLISKPTKAEIRNLLDQTIKVIEERMREEQSEVYSNILNQLLDIYQNIQDKNLPNNTDEIFGRYSFSAIAVKNLKEDDELRQKLCDIFQEIFEYKDNLEE